MTTVTPLPAAEFLEARLRRWTPGEFRRMTQDGIFGPSESAQLVDGEVYTHGQRHLWTRDEYYRLGDSGLLPPGERTELLDGRIIRKVTMNPPHATAVLKTAEALRPAFPKHLVMAQRPTDLSTHSDPEPDVIVVTGSLDDYSYRHPTSDGALLVVEVSDSTLREDRRYKAGLYARAGLPEYWIVNINARTLEVRRRPEDGEYLSLDVYAEGEAVAPLAAPNSPVRVADLLPLARPTPAP